MPKKSKWHWPARKSVEGPDSNSPKASIRLPERPPSRPDASNSRLPAPVDSAAGLSPNTSIGVASNYAGTDTPQATEHRAPQDEGPSGVHAGKKDYWQLAIDELQKEDSSIRGKVAAVQRAAAETGDADFAAQLLHTTQQEQKELESKRWKISVGSREVALRDHFDRLVNAMTFLKDVSKSVGNVDPVHAGLPLAGFCVLMQMATNDSEQYAAIVTGVEEVVTILARYSQIEAIYHSRANTALKQEFERHLVCLYKQIIRYQISATCYYRKNTMLRFLRAMPKLDDLSEVMAAIRRYDGACRGISQVFDSSDAPERHQELLEILKRLEKYLILQEDIGAPSKPTHTHWTVTRSINTLFTGRDELLTELETVARDAVKDPSRFHQCRMVITGIGGQGKSEICVQLAHRVRQAFWAVFWVDVSTTSSAESAFLHIASKLQIPAQTYVEAVEGLADTQHPWLLVLDNADDPEVDYQRYLPTGPWGVVVLTSRNQECEIHATAKSINLDGLSDAEASELLLRAAKTPKDQYQILEDDAGKVAALLQSHPLALIQAGSYIAGGYSTMADYPSVFAENRRRLLKFHPTQAQSRYQDVYATFEASAEILQLIDTDAAADALELLPVLATFDSNRLPLPLFEAGWKEARTRMAHFNSARDDADDTLKITQWHTSHLLPLMQVDADQWDPFRLIEAVNLLKAFSLVTTDTSSGFLSVSMHPLVHAWARDRQDLKEQDSSWITSGCIMALSAYDQDTWLQNSRQLRPHLHAFIAWDRSNLFVCHPPKKIARILLNCGWLLNGMRDSAQVYTITQGLFMSLDLDIRIVKEEWLEFFELTANNLRQHGQLNEAMVLLNQIVNLQEQRLPEEDMQLLGSQHELARARLENGQIQEAITLSEKVVRIRDETQREDHPNRLASQHQLASAYGTNGRIQEAITLLEKVVKIMEETLTEDHPDRLASQHELAREYSINGQIEEAVIILERVVTIKEQTLREDHPDRLISQHNLATYHWDLDRRDTAFEMMAHVVKIRQQVLLEDHPDLLLSQHNLATCHWALGRRDTAFEMIAHVVKIQRKVLLEGHPDLLSSQHNLATYHWDLDRRDTAFEMMAHVVKIQRKVLLEGHPDLLSSQHNLATYHWDLDRRDTAFEMMAHVVKIQRKVLLEDHPDRIDSEKWLEFFQEELHDSEAG